MSPRTKYKNQPVVVDGIRFASKREAHRYGELKLLQRAGEISGLQRQPRFVLSVQGQEICSYIGDFQYSERKGHPYVIEDVKGFETPEFKIKWRLAQALHPGIDWRLVR